MVVQYISPFIHTFQLAMRIKHLSGG